MSTPRCVTSKYDRHSPACANKNSLVSVRATHCTSSPTLPADCRSCVWQIHENADHVTIVSRPNEGGRHWPYFAKNVPLGTLMYENAVDSCMPLKLWLSFTERNGVPFRSGITDALGRVHFSSKFVLTGAEHDFLLNPHLPLVATPLHEWFLCDWSPDCNVVFDEDTRRFMTCRDVKTGESVLLGLKSDLDIKEAVEEANLQKFAASLLPHLDEIDDAMWEFLARPAPIDPWASFTPGFNVNGESIDGPDF